MYGLPVPPKEITCLLKCLLPFSLKGRNLLPEVAFIFERQNINCPFAKVSTFLNGPKILKVYSLQ